MGCGEAWLYFRASEPVAALFTGGTQGLKIGGLGSKYEGKTGRWKTGEEVIAVECFAILTQKQNQNLCTLYH